MRKVLFFLAFVCGLAVMSMRAADAIPMPYTKIAFFDDNGDPANGYKLCSYSSGTSTPLSTYTNATATALNTNPVILDSSGRAAVWLGNNSYKLVLMTPGSDSTCATGSIVWTQDGVNNYLLLSRTNTWSGTQTFNGAVTFNSTVSGIATLNVKTLEGIRFADQFAGGSVTAKINAAVADCPAYSSSDAGCIVVIPTGMACGEGSQTRDNVLLWDLRGCAQSQGLRYNLSATAAGGVRSKMLLQDNFGAINTPLSGTDSSASLYVLTKPDYPEATTATIAAINGTISTDAQNANFTGNLIGIEGSAFAGSTNATPRTSADVRGGTFNVSCGGNTSCTSLVSLFAQRPVNSGSGAVQDAYSMKIEEPTLTVTGERRALLNVGKTRLADVVSIGSTAANTNSSALSIYDPANLTGTNQYGVSVAIQTTSGATSEGGAGKYRADVAAATTQNLNYGLVVQTPLIGAGGSIGEWDGILIQSGPTATTKYAIKASDPIQASAYKTSSNCASSASPAVCASASSGAVAVAAGSVNLVVNTTAVTANSRIFVQRDNGLGATLSVTCNTQNTAALGAPFINGKSAGTSFTVQLDAAPTTDPLCLSYFIVN